MILRRFLPAALALAALIALVPWTATAQEQPDVPHEVVWSASGAAPGGTITLAIVYEVPEGHHITDREFGLLYLDPDLPEGVEVVETIWPEGTVEHGEEMYRGDAAVQYVLQVDEDVIPGEYHVPYDYSYQLCQDFEPQICYLPAGGSGETVLTVLEQGATPIPASHELFGGGEDVAPVGDVAGTVAAEGGGLENRLTRALERGSVMALLLVFVAGILVSFTPCVYPMIPIIIGFVGGSAEGSRFKGFILSVFFVLGLAVTYSILGVIAGATGSLFGSFMANPVVLWVIVGVFVLLGASMLGAFDITVPAGLQGRLMSGERKGVLGAVLVGAVTGIIAAPCAGPPLLVLLSWIGNSGNLVMGFVLMAVFALGLGVLFIVIGTFAGAMTSLPQAGPWMDTIKKGLGIVIFAVALYYLNLLLPGDLFTVLLGAFLLLTGLFMGAAARWGDLGTAGRWGKGIGILLVLAGAFYFLLGLGRTTGVQFAAASAGGAAAVTQAEEEHVPWIVDEHDRVLEMAAGQNMPVLVDFYADWCGVCVELEHNVWNQPEVIEAADQYIPLKLDYTRASPELEALRRQYNVGGLPTVLILSPRGEPVDRFTSFKQPGEVVDWLERHAR